MTWISQYDFRSRYPTQAEYPDLRTPPAMPDAEPDDPEATWSYEWYGLAKELG
jgi:hypothetical protein